MGKLSHNTSSSSSTTIITEVAFAYLEILSAYLGAVLWESQALVREAGAAGGLLGLVPVPGLVLGLGGPPAWRLPCVGGSGWEEVLCARRRCRHPACHSLSPGRRCLEKPGDGPYLASVGKSGNGRVAESVYVPDAIKNIYKSGVFRL